MNDAWITGGLLTIVGLVLALPFLSHKVEKQLEVFLFVMGVLAVTISGLWSRHLVAEAIEAPIKITLAVLTAGLVFRLIRSRLGAWASALATRLGLGGLFFLIVVVLGLLSSVITAIIAALILAEIVGALRLPRHVEIRLVVIACFSIGIGAVLTPIGEPLSAIAVEKLKGEPYQADFFFLMGLLGKWMIPLVFGLGLLAALWPRRGTVQSSAPTEDRPEPVRDTVVRAIKVYLFVLALVLLGEGFTPVVNQYLMRIPAAALYWVNIVSAVLDNATLTAAEVTPLMPEPTIKMLLAGLLMAGGMLIPGNIPNIICANKLSIKSREWAALGIPLGLALMIGCFALLVLSGL